MDDWIDDLIILMLGVLLIALVFAVYKVIELVLYLGDVFWRLA